MDKVYAYTAFDSFQNGISSKIMASSKNDAIQKLQSMNIDVYKIQLDVSDTFNIMTSSFNLKEMSRFYNTIGKRIRNGSKIGTGLQSSIGFIDDVRLKSCIFTLKTAYEDGVPLGKAMGIAGFPDRHAKAISAMEASGNIDEAFISLAKECKREHDLKSRIGAMLRQPKIFLTMVIVMFYGTFGFLSPTLLTQLTKIVGGEENLTPFTQKYKHFIDLFHGNLIFSSIIYFSVVLALLYFLRSKAFKTLIENIKIVKSMSERADHAGLWQRFGLMYKASMNITDAAIMVADSAKRKQSRESFMLMEGYIQQGIKINDAVRLSNFPDYIIRSIDAGDSTDGEMGDAMISLSSELYEDVDVLTEKLTERLGLAVLLGMGMVLMIFFLLTYYPMVSTTLSKL